MRGVSTIALRRPGERGYVYDLIAMRSKCCTSFYNDHSNVLDLSEMQSVGNADENGSGRDDRLCELNSDSWNHCIVIGQRKRDICRMSFFQALSVCSLSQSGFSLIYYPTLKNMLCLYKWFGCGDQKMYPAAYSRSL
jgi:hypothetical protein